MGGISLWPALLYMKTRQTAGQIGEVEATTVRQEGEICFTQRSLQLHLS